jgi:aspartyl-tRNA(Asn)/glutamyl-tRNA(Gln) amidotransferase subunit A
MQTVVDAARRLAAGEVSSAGLTEAALARAEDPAGEGRCVFTLLFPDAAKAEAEASDLLRAEGIVPSPIAGIPVSIKDLFDVRGYATTAGSAALRGMPPAAEDAAIVRRLRASGAVIVGRTNMPEFACSSLGLNRDYGTPRNSWDRAIGRIPGGSSSGAAISVTDGMSIAAIGTDTGGSVRIPAALNGLAGFKPTQRRVPLDGCFPLSTSLDSIGPIGASVACCALLDGVLSGGAITVPDAIPLERLSFAVPRRSFLFDGLEAPVARAFEHALTILSAAGARIVDIDLPGLVPDRVGLTVQTSLIPAESFAIHRAHLAERQARCDPRVMAGIVAGAQMSAPDYIDLLNTRRSLIAETEAALAGFHGWLAPTSPVLPPTIASFEGDDAAYHEANGGVARNTAPVNMLDGCGLTVPCHEFGTGPVGLMLVGGAGADRQILAAGLSIEAALNAALGR